MSAAIEALKNITTGTITTMLLKKGIRRCWMAGAMPFGRPGHRIVGPAFTLRFVPVREDLATPESWSKPISTRSAIEDMPSDCVVVADAMGVTTAGIFGDILCMRMVKRGVTALITDGVMRDKHGVLATRLTVWGAGVARPAPVHQPHICGVVVAGSARLGQPTDICRVERADRLRRLRDLPGRRRGRR